MSTARVSAIGGVIWGLIVGILIVIGTGVTDYMGRFFTGYQTLMPMTGTVVLIALPIAYGITGLICGYIVALVYNFVAEKFGGIKIDLR